ncbi:MAG TPA: hypothetical protein VD837_16390 [Terriglobales bacterium]|nr:hypothetical protein [Terriglobales bacterium]
MLGDKRRFVFVMAVGIGLVATAVATTMMQGASAVQPPIPMPTRESFPVYLASGKVLRNAHEVVGRVTGPSPATVKLSGAARFTSAETYFCTVSSGEGAQSMGPQVINVAGASFRIVHAAGGQAVVTYRCIGM